jgi:hypothetical protein
VSTPAKITKRDVINFPVPFADILTYGEYRCLQAIVVQCYRIDRGYAWPSYEYVAGQAIMPLRSAVRAVNGLVEKGVLIKNRQGGRGRANEYVPNWDLYLTRKQCHGRHCLEVENSDTGDTVSTEAEGQKQCHGESETVSPGGLNSVTGDTPSPISRSESVEREDIARGAGADAPPARESDSSLDGKTPVSFQDLWRLHPHGDKSFARKAYAKAIKNGTKPEDILAGLRRFLDGPEQSDYLASWLAEKGWLEDPLPPRSSKDKADKADKAVKPLARAKLKRGMPLWDVAGNPITAAKKDDDGWWVCDGHCAGKDVWPDWCVEDQPVYASKPSDEQIKRARAEQAVIAKQLVPDFVQVGAEVMVHKGDDWWLGRVQEVYLEDLERGQMAELKVQCADGQTFYPYADAVHPPLALPQLQSNAEWRAAILLAGGEGDDGAAVLTGVALERIREIVDALNKAATLSKVPARAVHAVLMTKAPPAVTQERAPAIARCGDDG